MEIKQTNSKSIFCEFDCCESRQERFKVTIKSGNQVLNYGEFDSLPQFLLYLYENCPINNGIIKKKVDYIKGSGFNLSTGNATELLERSNNGEGIWSLINKLAYDLVIFGGYSIEVIPNIFKTLYSINYADFSRLRWIKPENTPVVDKLVYKKLDNDIYTPDYIYPIYKSTEFDYPQIVYTKVEYCPGHYYYPLPSYFSAVKDIESDIGLNEWRQQLIEGNFTPSSIITIPVSTGEDEHEALVQKVRDLTRKKQGGILLLEAENEFVTSFTPLSLDPFKKEFESFMNASRENIIIAHGLTSKALVALQEGATLGGDGNALAVSQTEFYKSQIIPAQNNITNTINKLIKDAGIDDEISIINEEPVSVEPPTV